MISLDILFVTIAFYINMDQKSDQNKTAQSAGAVEYANYISAQG